jgi:hypothetical protein
MEQIRNSVRRKLQDVRLKQLNRCFAEGKEVWLDNSDLKLLGQKEILDPGHRINSVTGEISYSAGWL